ncbi:MAG: NUDIX domain-containing protein [Patescibacteria group bacterium]
MDKKTVICVDKDKNEHEVDVKDLVWRPSVYGVYIQDEKILLSKQWDGYDFPGGGIDIHETIDEALRREFFEETGMNIESLGKIVECKSSFYKPTSNKYKSPINSVLVYYIIEKASGKLSIENIAENEQEYLDMPEWIPLSEIENLKFYNSIDSVSIINKAVALI